MPGFKDETVQHEYAQVPSMLALICAEFERLSLCAGIVPVVTRVREAVCGSSGVHEAGRAVDFRDEHGGEFLYPDYVRTKIVESLNARYTRTDGKPTVLWHSFQGAPHHFHCQLASDLSVYRPKEGHENG